MSRLPFLILLLAHYVVGTIALNHTIPEATVERFHRWAEEHGMQFHSSEKAARMRIFSANLNKINAHNKKRSPYKLKLNKFAHLTFAEFSRKYLGLTSADAKCDNAMRDGRSARNMHFTHAHVEAPAHVDWRRTKAVTSVKDQGDCGSCWAFASAAAIESITQIARGRQVNVSTQQFVDCDKDDYGCNGGDPVCAFRYAIANKGVDTWQDYPYKGIEGTCQAKNNPSTVSINSFVQVPANNETAMMQAVAAQPIAVGIEADFTLQFYWAGVYSGPCGGNINHAIVIVGYGSTLWNNPYWIIKNSWGTEWGQNGFGKFKRNHWLPRGMCGIAKKPVYPVI